MQKSKYLKTGIRAVEEAEKVILKYFDTDLNIETKKDGSPVTIADKQAEQVIREIISESFPDHGFVGEEFGETGGESEFSWIIDPIDGTKNFSHGIPFFSTEVALLKGNEIILGISNAPALKKFVFAEKNQGAYTKSGKKLNVSSVSNLKDAFISTGGLKHFEKMGKVKEFQEIGEKCLGMKGFGDSWSYHFVAEGKLDVVLEAKVRIWDIAAISIIVEEAGGKVTDLKGNSISLSSKSILASNKVLHQEILNYFI